MSDVAIWYHPAMRIFIHLSRLIRISLLAIVLIASALAFFVGMGVAAWLVSARFLEQLRLEEWPAFMPYDQQTTLYICAIGFVPCLIIARLCWIALEWTLETYWTDDWHRWQQWKAKVTGAPVVS